MKVLIVDDSKVMRMIVARALRQSGMANIEIGEAEDGVDGLATAASFQPDLILSDWNMPQMNGVEFLTNLRANGSTTRFGFITSETHPAIMEQALEAGADFLLTKPFNADQFEKVFAGMAG